MTTDQLQQTLQLYRALAEMTSDYLYSARITEQGQVVHKWISDSFQCITGYTPAELGFEGLWTGLVHPDDVWLIEGAFAHILAGEPYVETFRIITKRGQVRWLREFTRPELDATRRVIGFLGAGQDVTEHQLAEAALRASERNLRLIAENTTDCVFAYDLQRRLLYVNSAFEQLTEYTVEELRQENFIDYMHPEDRERMLALFDATFRGQSFGETEYRMITKSGVVKWCSSSCGPLLDDEGRQIGVQGRERDISARVQAEQERLAVERKLQETQKLESLGVLAGGIAHDFNNLLQAIYGNASLALMETPVQSPIHDLLTQIEAASHRASDLVQQLLAYAGKGNIVVQPLNLNEVVREMTGLLRASIPRSIQIDYLLSQQAPIIQADATQIRQVVMNLLINAAEAIGNRDGTITISTKLRCIRREELTDIALGSDAQPGQYVALEVVDNGVGMDEATLTRIFDPFFTTKFTGRGLGLAAVQGIVRAHRGALRVSSNLDQGTTFMMLFPSATAIAAPQAAVTASQAWRTHGTVLVIDDEDGVRSVTARLLERFGFQVLAAADGKAGIAMFEAHQHEVSCVLLDVVLPGMNGEQVATYMRTIDPCVPIILMSGYTEDEVRARVPGDTGHFILQKPFMAAELREVIKRVLASYDSIPQD